MISGVGQSQYTKQTSYQGWGKKIITATKIVAQETKEAAKRAVRPTDPEIKAQTAASIKHSSDILHGRREPKIVADY